MKKRYAITGMMIFAWSFLYGVIGNCILREGERKIAITSIQGFLVGCFSAILFYLFSLFFGFAFYKIKLNRIGKFWLMLENTMAVMCLMYVVTSLISNGKGISYSHAWMHVVNLLFSILIVSRINDYGKSLGKTFKP